MTIMAIRKTTGGALWHLLRAKLSNSSLRLLQTFAKRLVAFANTKGGTLYIGVEDNGTVVGVNSADRVTLQINNMVR